MPKRRRVAETCAFTAVICVFSVVWRGCALPSAAPHPLLLCLFPAPYNRADPIAARSWGSHVGPRSEEPLIGWKGEKGKAVQDEGGGRISAGRSPFFVLGHAAAVSTALISPSEAAPANHASTIVELEGGAFLAAWFAGEQEDAAEVNIQVATYDAGTKTWGSPVVVASDPDHPCWNPFSTRTPSGRCSFTTRSAPLCGNASGL